MKVRELIQQLIELNLDDDVFVEVNDGGEEYEISAAVKMGSGSYRRALVLIDGVPVEGEE